LNRAGLAQTQLLLPYSISSWRVAVEGPRYERFKNSILDYR
jgi:hypothetical protein